MSSSDVPLVVGEPERAVGSAKPREVWREATTMVLYVSIVLLAELAALPAGRRDEGEALHGPVGWELLAIVWGTALGVAIAHWFAFRLAAVGFSAGRLTDRDLAIGRAELIGALCVAALASLPVLLLSEEAEQQVVPFVPALIVGGVGYLLARTSGRSRLASLGLGGTVLLVGLVVATVKYLLSGR